MAQTLKFWSNLHCAIIVKNITKVKKIDRIFFKNLILVIFFMIIARCKLVQNFIFHCYWDIVENFFFSFSEKTKHKFSLSCKNKVFVTTLIDFSSLILSKNSMNFFRNKTFCCCLLYAFFTRLYFLGLRFLSPLENFHFFTLWDRKSVV